MQIDGSENTAEAAPVSNETAPDSAPADGIMEPEIGPVPAEPAAEIDNAPSPVTAQAASNPATPAASPATPNPYVTRPEYGVGTYTVVKGDTMFSIAKKAGLDLGVLSAANNISDPAAVKAGQTLYIPAKPGSVHVARPGETLQSVAEKYQLKSGAIGEANHLNKDAKLSPGQLVLIPGVDPKSVTAMPAASTPKPPTVTPATSKSQTVSASSAITPLPSPKSAQVVPPAAVAVGARAPRSVGGDMLVWPVGGPLSTSFSPSHRGLDVVANKGIPVKAALPGRVVEATESAGPYGWYVMLEHGGGISTVYAHLSKIRVKVGDSLKKGQTVGEVGSTGQSTGAHLHFELRQSNVPIDPRPYLP
jgi:murein DD-endopeptidase MepM/ murein hydrolase activator NlpD